VKQMCRIFYTLWETWLLTTCPLFRSSRGRSRVKQAIIPVHEWQPAKYNSPLQYLISPYLYVFKEFYRKYNLIITYLDKIMSFLYIITHTLCESLSILHLIESYEEKTTSWRRLSGVAGSNKGQNRILKWNKKIIINTNHIIIDYISHLLTSVYQGDSNCLLFQPWQMVVTKPLKGSKLKTLFLLLTRKRLGIMACTVLCMKTSKTLNQMVQCKLSAGKHEPGIFYVFQ
jgi:hypothetical protein